MPLFVQGEVLNESCLSIKTLVQRFGPCLEEGARTFLSQPVKEISSPGLLYVFQREFATVAPTDDNVTIMGSEDATTCHIVCLRNRDTGVTSLAHLDGYGMQDAINKMTTSITSDTDTNEVDVHLFGGFLDDRQFSEEITHEILAHFHKQVAKIHLCTFCVTDLNDTIRNGQHYPVVYGIGINVKNGEIFSAMFPDKGPEFTLRHVRNFTGGKEVLQVYSSLIGELLIGPFDYGIFEHAPLFMQAPDHVVLKYLSTSPHCEPAGFCDEIRATMQYLMNNPQPLQTVFPDGTPHRYVRNSDNEWQCVQKP